MLATFASDPFGWSSWEQLERIQDEMERVFALRRPGVASYPPVNVWVGDTDAVVTVELPGYDSDSLDISVHDSTLTLKGKRAAVTDDDAKYLLRERSESGFTRQLELPFAIEGDHVQARFRNGLLSITLPRRATDQPRRVAIEVS